jgi:hypothetical protein
MARRKFIPFCLRIFIWDHGSPSPASQVSAANSMQQASGKIRMRFNELLIAAILKEKA